MLAPCFLGFVQFLFGNNCNKDKGLYTKVKGGPCFMDHVFYYPSLEPLLPLVHGLCPLYAFIEDQSMSPSEDIYLKNLNK